MLKYLNLTYKLDQFEYLDRKSINILNIFRVLNILYQFYIFSFAKSYYVYKKVKIIIKLIEQKKKTLMLLTQSAKP